MSRDGGTSFAALAAATNDGIIALTYSPTSSSDGRVLLASSVQSPNGVALTSLQTSSDGGRTFQPLSTQGLDLTVNLNALTMLPDGRILAALQTGTPSGTYGVRCSSDGGATWSLTC